jgi:hypothetical protein
VQKLVYSVWVPQKRGYDYYEAAGSLRAGVIAPNPRIRASSPLGATIDEASRRLPAGAKYVGSGELARGMIASRNSGALGAFPDVGAIPLWAIALGIGAFFYLKKRRR